MSVELKFELFAHDLFSKLFFENKVREKICDGKVHYSDECVQDDNVGDHQEQIYYDDCYYQAVVCRQYFYRRIYQEEFAEHLSFFTSSFSDFCDYVHVMCDRLDLFGNLFIFNCMLASLAFIAELCLFCYSNGHKSFIKIAHLCWALHFDKFRHEFYEQGGWKIFHEMAHSYRLPFIFVTSHLEPKITRSYVFTSLTKLHLSLADFVISLNSGLNKNKTTALKDWNEFRQKNYDKFLFVLRQYKQVKEEPQISFQAELLLKYLIILCYPYKSTIGKVEGNSECRSFENQSDFPSSNACYSFITNEGRSLLQLEMSKDKEILHDNNENKTRLLENEKNLQQKYEIETLFQQLSEKEMVLQHLSNTEVFLQKLSEDSEIFHLLSEYEDVLKKLYKHEEKDLLSEFESFQQLYQPKLPEQEGDIQQHSKYEKISRKLTVNKRILHLLTLELFERNQPQFSELKENHWNTKIEMNFQHDRDREIVPLTSPENPANINSQENLFSTVESFENTYLTGEEHNTTLLSPDMDSEDTNSQNTKILNDSFVLFEIQKNTDENTIEQSKYVKKDSIVVMSEDAFTCNEHEVNDCHLDSPQNASISSDNKITFPLSKKQEWISPHDTHLKTESPNIEDEKNATYKTTTFSAGNEVSTRALLSKGEDGFSPFEVYLMTGKPIRKDQDYAFSSTNIQPSESTLLNKLKETSELKEKNLGISRYEIYKTMSFPHKNPCAKHSEIGLSSKNKENISFSPTHTSTWASCEETEAYLNHWNIFHQMFDYESKLLRMVCDHSLKENATSDFENTVTCQIYRSPPVELEEFFPPPIFSSTVSDLNNNSLNAQNDVLAFQEVEDRIKVPISSFPEKYIGYLLPDDNKNFSDSSTISDDQNKDSLSARNVEVASWQMENQKQASTIRNYQETFWPHAEQFEQVSTTVEDPKGDTIHAEDKKLATEVPNGHTISDEEKELKQKVSNSEKPIKNNKRNKKKNRKRNKMHSNENARPPLFDQIGCHTSEDKVKHSSKSVQSKERTQAEANGDIYTVSTEIVDLIKNSLPGINQTAIKEFFIASPEFVEHIGDTISITRGSTPPSVTKSKKISTSKSVPKSFKMIKKGDFVLSSDQEEFISGLKNGNSPLIKMTDNNSAQSLDFESPVPKDASALEIMKESDKYNSAQSLDCESPVPKDAAALETMNESDKYNHFPLMPINNANSCKKELNASNRDLAFNADDEKTFLINNILTLGVENKRCYLTSIFKEN